MRSAEAVMYAPGRRPSRAPPLVPKSAGTACGPNTALSTFAAFLIDSGIANVQAMIQRISGDLIESPLNTGDS
jgi:hypothetical protein